MPDGFRRGAESAVKEPKRCFGRMIFMIQPQGRIME